MSARGVAYLNVDMAVDGKAKTRDINYSLREVFNLNIAYYPFEKCEVLLPVN